MTIKNQGCVIAGCAGAAILAVVLGVAVLAIGMYLYKMGEARRVEQVYEQSPVPPPPLPPAGPAPAPALLPQPAPAPAYAPSAAPASYSSPLLQQPTLTEDLQVELVARTLEGFQQAVNVGTFRGFQQFFVAEAAKSTLTTQVFDQSFTKFLTMKMDIYPQGFRQNPKITRRRNLNERGTYIELAGDYTARNPHGARKVTWSMKYLYEQGRGWGVAGISIEAVPVR